jgi:hypothetical protein
MTLQAIRHSLSPSGRTLPVRWSQGEHVAVIGDTGTGKTYLVSKLIALRNYVVVLRTKPDDIAFPGFRRFTTAKAGMEDWRNNKILLEPDYRFQAREGAEMLEYAWSQRKWTIVVDEGWYAERLGLQKLMERLWTQGRSVKISLVVGMQRPVEISRFTISQATHLFTFRVEGRDLKTIRDSTTPRIVEPVHSLTGHDFIYFNRPGRFLARGNARRLDRIIIGVTNNNGKKP